MTFKQACREALKQSRCYSYGWYVCYERMSVDRKTNFVVHPSYMISQNMDGTYPTNVYFYAHHNKLFRCAHQSAINPKLYTV